MPDPRQLDPDDAQMDGPFFVCPECGERYWDWHICPDQRERIAKWQSYTLDHGTQGSTLDGYTALEWLLVDMRSANTIAAMLQAAKDAMERKEGDDGPTDRPKN